MLVFIMLLFCERSGCQYISSTAIKNRIRSLCLILYFPITNPATRQDSKIMTTRRTKHNTGFVFHCPHVIISQCDISLQQPVRLSALIFCLSMFRCVKYDSRRTKIALKRRSRGLGHVMIL